MLGSIAIIEDDNQVNSLINEALTLKGYHTLSCYDGGQGIALLKDNTFDLILLDILLPHIDGFNVLEQLRQFCQTPVIILSALDTEKNRIKGFKAGADDYLTKPFSMDELLLRIEAIIRRTNIIPPLKQVNNSLYFEKIDLTSIEYKILQLLNDNVNQTLSKPILFREALFKNYQTYDRTLDMHISKIRKKIVNNPDVKAKIITVHGKGYRLVHV